MAMVTRYDLFGTCRTLEGHQGLQLARNNLIKKENRELGKRSDPTSAVLNLLSAPSGEATTVLIGISSLPATAIRH